MNRRGFLSLLGMTIGGVILEEAIPLGRVWSFPSQIRLGRPILTTEEITLEALKILERELKFSQAGMRRWPQLPGAVLQIRKPANWAVS